jgi:hypothetical protein
MAMKADGSTYIVRGEDAYAGGVDPSAPVIKPTQAQIRREAQEREDIERYRRHEEGEIGSSSSFLDVIVSKFPMKEVEAQSWSYTHVIAVIPPVGGSIEARFSVSGSIVKCCHRKGSQAGENGLLFRGRITLALDAGVGTTVGNASNAKVGKEGSGKDRHKVRTIPRKTRTGGSYVHNRKNNHVIPKTDINGGKRGPLSVKADVIPSSETTDNGLPPCENSFKGGIRLYGYAQVGLGKVGSVRLGGFTATVEIGSCTISDGCKWDFEESRVEYDSSVAGARAAVVIEGTVTADIVLYTTKGRGDSGK